MPLTAARQALLRAADASLDTSLLRLVVLLYCLRRRVSSQTQIFDLLGSASRSYSLAVPESAQGFVHGFTHTHLPRSKRARNLDADGVARVLGVHKYGSAMHACDGVNNRQPQAMVDRMV